MYYILYIRGSSYENRVGEIDHFRDDKEKPKSHFFWEMNVKKTEPANHINTLHYHKIFSNISILASIWLAIYIKVFICYFASILIFAQKIGVQSRYLVYFATFQLLCKENGGLDAIFQIMKTIIFTGLTRRYEKS